MRAADAAVSGVSTVKADWALDGKIATIARVFQVAGPRARRVILLALRMGRRKRLSVKECRFDCREITPFFRSEIA